MTTPLDAVRGALYGHLCGDALGVPYEFLEPDDVPAEIAWSGGGAHRQPAGTFSDDGALMLAAAASLLAREGFDADDFGRRCVRWLDEGELACGGTAFDAGGTTRGAIDRLRAGCPAEQAGPTDPARAGNGALMRIVPIALWTSRDPVETQIWIAMRASSVTHGAPASRVACAAYALLVRALLRDESPQHALTGAWSTLEAAPDVAHNPGLRAALAELRAYQQRTGSGFVFDCFWSAFDAFAAAEDYVDAVRRAIRYGRDTDTTACVAGGLAGLGFGVAGIPREWRDGLRLTPAQRILIEDFADHAAQRLDTHRNSA
ncbi:MAG: ADP-ribosylglycohydrolase family protein [Phycisphaerae bacterium]